MNPTAGENKESLPALASFNALPIGAGVSISSWVAECVKIFQAKGLQVRVNALGTEVEGDIGDILDGVAQCHHLLHELGLNRIVTHLTLSTRTDRAQSLTEKRDAVLTRLNTQKDLPETATGS